MQHRLIFALACAATPALSAPVTLQLPAGASQIGTRVDAPAQYAMPIAGFDGTQVPVQMVQGALDQRAFRLDGSRDNTLALMLPLSDQLTKAGYTLVYQCATTQCGGFDFRFALDVLPEPQMHVDLGDFRYLAAKGPGGDVITLLVSRSADQAFVQVTTVTAGAVATADPAAGRSRSRGCRDARDAAARFASPDRLGPDGPNTSGGTPSGSRLGYGATGC